MKATILLAIGILCVLVLPNAYGLIGDSKTTFKSNGYITQLTIEYNGTKTIGLVEGSGGGGGIALDSNLTIKIYDNTTDLPYVEIYDNDDLIDSFRMYEKEVARLWVTGDNGNETMIIITDMEGDRSAWINLVDYTCTGNETISPFMIFGDNYGTPSAIVFTWMNGCEQLAVPLYHGNYPFFANSGLIPSGHMPFVEN
jgi:hypothetical protein